MKVDDWLKAGYKRYEVRDKQMHKLADFLLQKRFDDEKGKKYFITVYCYDRTTYPEPHKSMLKDNPVGFMPTTKFVLGDHLPFFNIEMNAVESLYGGIDEIEDWFESFWRMCKQPYYEEWS